MSTRNVLITGANQGIGLGIAQKFASAGDKVLMIDVATTPSDEAIKVMEQSGGHYYSCDITNKAAVQSEIADMFSHHGSIEVLINNAGVTRWKSFMDTTEEDINYIFDVNVKGIYHVTQPVVAEMIKVGQGAIINTASMGGKWGSPNESAYCASKAAVIELTKIMAMELGAHHIRVNSICPGIIKTSMSNGATTPDTYWLERTPLNRLGKPDDVADVAYFLASNEARYMTGQAINVTGGMIMY